MATINRSNIQNNGTNTTNGKANSTRTNGNGATARAARLQAKTESRRTTSSQTVEERAAELLEEVRNAIYKSFKVKLQTRDKRIAVKVGHATKEKLGLDIAAQIRKSGKQMNWDKWNNQVFPKLFGRPDALDHDVEVVALCMAMLYDVFELDVNQAIKGLVEFNQESLKKRNDYKKESETDDEDDDEDEEELLDLENEDESEDSDLTEDEDEDDEDDELE